jgi:hypothetical protein
MLKHSEIVIGAGLNAVVYAYLTDAVILGDFRLGPAPFDFLSPETDLSLLGLDNVNYDLFGSPCLTVGASKRDIWERLVFMKSLSGTAPMSEKLENIRIDMAQQTVTAAGCGASVTYQYDALRVFDASGVGGIEQLATTPSLSQEKHKVVDWINVRSGCRHKFDYLSCDSDFVKEIYFYPSDRMHGDHDIKDAVAISYLNDDELNNYEFSDTYARMKVTAIMKNNGIRGTRNGRDTRDPSKFKYYALKLESAYREVYRSRTLEYFDKNNIFFDTRKTENILSSYPQPDNYADKLNQGLFIV